MLKLCTAAAGLAALSLLRLRRRRAAGKTRVWLIRHGESEFNAGVDAYFAANPEEEARCLRDIASWWEEPDHFDPATPDAPLTAKGRGQARALPGQVAGLPLELICVSPLSRALETMALAFAEYDPSVPVRVCPRAAERVNSSCDLGSSPAVLKGAFPAVDFGAIEGAGAGEWWVQSEDSSEDWLARLDPPRVTEPLESFARRMDALKAWIQGRPERTICLVCHAVVIHAFTGKWVKEKNRERERERERENQPCVCMCAYVCAYVCVCVCGARCVVGSAPRAVCQ
jgi:broad specificity phosphatase PhoE